MNIVAIFWVAVGLERGPLTPCEDKWGATWKKSSGSGLELIFKDNCLLESIKDVFLDLVPCSTSLNQRFGEHIVSIFGFLKFDRFSTVVETVDMLQCILQNLSSSLELVHFSLKIEVSSQSEREHRRRVSVIKQ
jgi:hypothetical protein